MNAISLHPALRQSLFITGTDTGAGKTTVSVQLLHALASSGLRAAAMKPVAAGATMTSHGWRNDDALDLAAAANVDIPYEWLNPICLPDATAPHIAAQTAGIHIELELIKSAFANIKTRSDVIIAEGAGGWFVPLDAANAQDQRQSMQDVALALRLPVVLVVGLRLGALNHALLTADAISRSGLPFAGWIANPVDPLFSDAGRYVEYLTRRLAAPLLWEAPRVILPGQ
jgi:dethiobiotin synthetase